MWVCVCRQSAQRIRVSHKNADITHFVLDDECYSKLDKHASFYILHFTFQLMSDVLSLYTSKMGRERHTWATIILAVKTIYVYNIYIHRLRYTRTHFAVFKFDERFLHSLPFCTYNFINIFNMPIRSWHNAIQLKHPQNTHSHTQTNAGQIKKWFEREKANFHLKMVHGALRWKWVSVWIDNLTNKKHANIFVHEGGEKWTL